MAEAKVTRSRVGAVLNWCLCGVSVTLGLLGLALLTQAYPSVRDMLLSTQSTGNGIAALTYPIVGALIVLHRPTNRVGWILCAAGLFNGLETFADGFSSLGLLQPGQPTLAVAWLNWLQSWMWALAFGPLITLLPLLFPDGELLSPRWRVVPWASVGWMVCMIAAIGLSPVPFDGSKVDFDAAAVMPGVTGVLPVLAGIGITLLPVTWLASVVSLVLRYRRARGRERLQIKWLTYVVALYLLVYPFVAFIKVFPNDVRLVLTCLALAAFGGVPVSVGIAILRHRLYDIDLIIRRTLVYGALSALLVVLYWISVLVLQQALGPLTQGSELAIVGSTLAVAALFQPLRVRIQQAVDHRFYRRRYDGARTVEAFTARLRAEVDLDSLSGELVNVVERTIQPARVSLWLRPSVTQRGGS